MTISMYSASVPVFAKMLHNLDVMLGKAEQHAASRGFDVAVLLAARLAPDMFALTRQVQIACDAAKFAVARLSGADAPSFPDQEATVAELQQRIRKTIEYIESVPPAQLDGSEAKPISVPVRGADPLSFEGEAYLKHHAMPNFYFHLTAAYAILRHNGVSLGKGDFLGRR
ncbi:DUF1993 domain-containing protein [Caldimonas brevitalea]|uniref:DUF1993 domain-containing protein n=1 Tax=Caldimonas brevitalea TaxID=413882 RepID=A0A0G3BQE3_9BURK|nr:DUF1993 domain-containing protein [Caldimonas brevitalea]AKJ29581.1 hypothetical protein AAW51_2890 [Caldimonas brevitalea]